MNGQLSIVHCLRAPVGGLFRHVCDLAAAQSDMGNEVGVVCDTAEAGEAAERALRNLQENVCALGVVRVPMSRQIGWRDFGATRAVRRFAEAVQAQVLHGHGAKGGAYARLAAHALKRKGQTIRAFYTPHGGSLHYDPASFKGRIYMALERRLASRSDGLIFESTYSSGLYHTNVGPFPCEFRIIPNGLKPEEFYEVVIDDDAGDFVFIGELRRLKGVDVLLHALAALKKTRQVRAFIAGGGPDGPRFLALARKLGIEQCVTFAGPTPARSAFTRGRCLIVPSRAESLPYVVLEAAAARLPFIATKVGGIPEIVDGTEVVLVPVDDAAALGREMGAFLDNSGVFVRRATDLQGLVAKRFSVEGMARAITDFYADRLRGAAET